VNFSLELPEELVEALVEHVLARVREQRRWLDGREALADYLGCSLSRVKDLRERGLPGKRIGRRLLFDRLEVDRWLEQL
jgi:excisionase family DNA binding protein